MAAKTGRRIQISASFCITYLNSLPDDADLFAAHEVAGLDDDRIARLDSGEDLHLVAFPAALLDPLLAGGVAVGAGHTDHLVDPGEGDDRGGGDEDRQLPRM